MELLVTIGIRLIEFLFFAGVIGSAIVVLITGVEDIETALGGSDGESAVTPEPQP